MRLALALRRLMVRSARRPAAWAAWRLVLELAARAVARWLAAGTGTSVWVRGSFGRGDAVPGLSDIDLVAVTGDDELGTALTHIRRRRVDESPTGLGRLVSVAIYEPGALEQAAAVDELRFALDDEGRAPDPRRRATRLRSRAPADELGLRMRAPLPAPWEGWRRLAGRRALAPVPAPDGPQRLTLAWFELQYWWRHAVRAASSPPGHLRSYMADKLTAESARLRVWLSQGEWPRARADALAALAGLGVEEERLAAEALAIERELPAPGPRPLEPALRALLAATQEVAGLHAAAARDAGPPTRVELHGSSQAPLAQPPGALPLADWRARCAPALPDEAFVVHPGDPREAKALADAMSGAEAALCALRTGDVLVQAGEGVTPLRGVQSAVSDPVSLALAGGEHVASFPDLPGWSARDCARRAVAEHRSWLAAQPERLHPNDRALGLLLTAARAARFLTGLETGSPSLALTATAAAETLAESGDEGVAAAAEAGLAELVECRGGAREPSREVVDALRAAVEELPPYAGSLAP